MRTACLKRLVRRKPNSISCFIQDQWHINSRLLFSTVKRKVKAGGLDLQCPIQDRIIYSGAIKWFGKSAL